MEILMDKSEFFEVITNKLKEILPGLMGEDVELVFNDVIKNNDCVMHGMSIMTPGQMVAPTMYLDDFYRMYCDGDSVEELIAEIFRQHLSAMNSAPHFLDMKLDYESVRKRLVFDILDAELNRERLGQLVHRPLEAGLEMVPYVVAEESELGMYRFAVTRAVAESEGYDEEVLLTQAVENTMEECRPLLTDIESMLLGNPDIDRCNPLDDDFELDLSADSYVLTTESGAFGAKVLFLPEMMKRIGNALMSDYYVVPSSIHEMIIYPSGSGVSETDLKNLLVESNGSIVRREEVLSNSLYFFDRGKEKLLRIA